MRQLTFKGFLYNYVRELSDCKSNRLTRLAKEARHDNPRLREPVLLYALFSYDWNTAYRLIRTNDKLIDDFNKYFHSYQSPLNLFKALEDNDASIPLGYLKVYKSYHSYKNRYANDNHTKSLMRNRIMELQEQKNVSTYKLYTDLKLNHGNFNAFMKNGQLDKLSLNNARNALDYLENL